MKFKKVVPLIWLAVAVFVFVASIGLYNLPPLPVALIITGVYVMILHAHFEARVERLSMD